MGTLCNDRVVDTLEDGTNDGESVPVIMTPFAGLGHIQYTMGQYVTSFRTVSAGQGRQLFPPNRSSTWHVMLGRSGHWIELLLAV